jgi:hypothetical protein
MASVLSARKPVLSEPWEARAVPPLFLDTGDPSPPTHPGSLQWVHMGPYCSAPFSIADSGCWLLLKTGQGWGPPRPEVTNCGKSIITTRIGKFRFKERWVMAA